MTWGSPSGRSRWGPAKLAYGGTAGPEEEQLAFEASLSAGVDLFDTAAMYSGGASERRVGELAEGRQVVIATKFPPGWHLDPFAHGVYGRRGGSGQGQGGRGEQRFRSPTPHRPRGAGRAGDPPSLKSSGVLPVASSAGGEWGAGCVQGAGDHANRVPATGPEDPHREVSARDRPKGIRRFGRYFRSDGLKKAQPVVALLGEIGERHSKTPAQVALRWLIGQEGILPIPGARR